MKKTDGFIMIEKKLLLNLEIKYCKNELLKSFFK